MQSKRLATHFGGYTNGSSSKAESATLVQCLESWTCCSRCVCSCILSLGMNAGAAGGILTQCTYAQVSSNLLLKAMSQTAMSTLMMMILGILARTSGARKLSFHESWISVMMRVVTGDLYLFSLPLHPSSQAAALARHQATWQSPLGHQYMTQRLLQTCLTARAITRTPTLQPSHSI